MGLQCGSRGARRHLRGAAASGSKRCAGDDYIAAIAEWRRTLHGHTALIVTSRRLFAATVIDDCFLINMRPAKYGHNSEMHRGGAGD